MELSREDAAAEEPALAGCDRQEVPGGVELGVADGEKLAPGQGACSELEILQVAGHLAGVVAQQQVADRHATIAADGEVEALEGVGDARQGADDLGREAGSA